MFALQIENSERLCPVDKFFTIRINGVTIEIYNWDIADMFRVVKKRPYRNSLHTC
jgi:hypothetical protein